MAGIAAGRFNLGWQRVAFGYGAAFKGYDMATAGEQANSSQGSNLYRASEVTLLSDDQWRIVKERYHLTPREIEISKLICRGLSNEDIANAVDIRYGTVKTHIRNIYRRVHVKSKVAMLLRFLEDSKAVNRKQ
jgi:DNA-binding NarL/FixJ family response regulator